VRESGGGALSGTVVIERAGRIATAGCASLLAALGARVIRVEGPEEARRLADASQAERLLRRGGKEHLTQPASQEAIEPWWRRLADAADVIVLDRPEESAEDAAVAKTLVADPAGRVVCALSPDGLSGALPAGASDPLIQALGGAMAVTGQPGGLPEAARVPVAEMSAAVLATTAILAALRVRARDGVGQLIDLSLVEVMADQLRTHLAMVTADPQQKFRIGSRHPVCVPWNVYRASDGWVLICSSSNAHWLTIADVIGRPELKSAPEFATVEARRARAGDVDGMVQDWVAARDTAAVVEALSAAGIPAGPALDIPGVARDTGLRAIGTVRAEDGVLLPGPAWHASRTPLKAPTPIATALEAIPGDLAPRRPAPAGATVSGPPLAGLRILDLTRFAAGPIAGLVLASLGAEIVKVEAPGGEETRSWAPRFGGVGGYFISYNAGKRSVVLDLRSAEGRAGLDALVASADALIHNVRPGALEKLGFGPAPLMQRHPRLIYASVSGFGQTGPKLAALDTVMQGRVGLTSLIGDGSLPCRLGFSIADQLSGHIAAAGILAALAERERSGLGQLVDVGMCDAVAWLTRLSWPNGTSAVGEFVRLEAADGWVVAAADRDVVGAALGYQATAQKSRSELLDALGAAGIVAAPVLEPAEVFRQASLRRRGSLYEIAVDGTMAPALAVPLGLTATPVLRPARLHALGEDQALVPRN